MEAKGRDSLMPGASFAGRYRVEQLLGEGAMGRVYRALDVEVGELVALKVLLPGLTRDEVALERFRREVRLARRVTHHNVVRTHDLGHHEGVHYLTMEWVEGQPLDAALRSRGRLSLADVLELGQQVCDGLQAAHAVGVVHRDLKPSNILLASDARVAITDFGIARSLLGDEDGAGTVGVLGTPHYMAPEQVEGGLLDGRTDLYALGCILFELLTGRLPFAGRTPLAQAMARLHDDPPDPRSLEPVPDAVAALVLRCLARDAARRPASAAELGRALAACGSARGELAAQAGAVPSLVPPGAAHAETLALPTLPPSSAPTPRLAPALPAGQSLAVLPFRLLGASEDHLGDALTDELIDVLSRTRGLRVFGSGATAAYRTNRDPRAVGGALGADVVVDGTVQQANAKVRISARLIDVKTGLQLWSEPFTGRFEDLFELQETMSRRIAEALRVELSMRHGTSDVPAEAMALYLRARHRIKDLQLLGEGGAVALLEQVLELAPELQPALAAHAIACIHAWFMPHEQGARDWGEAARVSVARALAAAGELAETQLAAAMLATEAGDYGKATAALVRASSIAPTYVDALSYLGGLLCEAGRFEAGLVRLELAAKLDPTQMSAMLSLARLYVLQGQQPEYERTMERLRGAGHGAHMACLQLELRVANWMGDVDRIGEVRDRMEASIHPYHRLSRTYAAFLLGEVPIEKADEMLRQAVATLPNRRFAALVCQQAVEALCRHDLDLARFYLRAADDRALLDVAWLELCPPLAELRKEAAFREIQRATLRRAAPLRDA